MSEIPETNPTQDGSLTNAEKAITGLLSKPEKKEESESIPEQAKPVAEETPKQEQAETEDRIEPASAAKEQEEDETPTPAPPLHKVKVDKEEREVTLEELKSSYAFTAHNTRKAQELSEERRQWEESAVKQQRERDLQWNDLLEQTKRSLQTIVPQKPDFEKLKATLPSEQYAARLEEWQAHQDRLSEIDQQQAEVRARQAKDAETAFGKRMEEEGKLLRARLPELDDPKKGEALRQSLVSAATEYGYTPEDLGQVADHRALILLHDAMQWRNAQAKRPAIQNKIEKAMETTPGPSKSTAPKQDKAREAINRLRQTHTTEDAASAIDALVGR